MTAEVKSRVMETTKCTETAGNTKAPRPLIESGVHAHLDTQANLGLCPWKRREWKMQWSETIQNVSYVDASGSKAQQSFLSY